MKKVFLGMLFLSSLLCGIVFPETLTLTKVGEYGTGYYLDVFVQGNYAYCAASGNGLDIINISNPAAPAFVANCDTPGEANGVYVSGNYAYVADGEGGLAIINITTPASPALAGTYNTPGTAGGVFVSGSYAYVADGENGLLIVNITTPASPSLTGSYNTTGNAWDVFLSGSTAYVADGLSGVQIINVTTPASPSLLGTFSTAGSTGGARGIWISGVYAYVAYWDKGLRIFDVTNPAAVVAQGFIDQTWEAWGVQVSGSYAYVAGDGNDFQIIDITLPATPSVTALIDTGGWAKAVYVSGSYVYMADYHRGLQVFNVTTPASPVLTATYDFSSEQRSVFVSGNYAYTASLRDGLKIFNITTPSAPVFVGGLEYAAEGEATGIYVSGNLAYLSYDTSGLHIINVSDPALPALVGQIDTPGNATDVFVSGSYAYVSDYDSGLQIINVSSPSSPTIAGTINTAGSAWSVAVNGNYAYVADGPEGLQIINITTPSSPTLAGTYNTDGDAVGVFISGSYAYVGDYYYGLQIINIANPSLPGLVGNYDTLGYARRVFVSGHYAFVPDWDYGLTVINVANPGTPTLAATYDTPGFAWKAYVAGDYAYLADGSSGKLFVLDVAITLTVSGTVTRGGVGLEGVVMSGLPGNPSTNASGVYTATVDYGWSGTVTPTLSGNSFIPASRTYSSLSADQTSQDYVAGYTVSGTVTRGGLGLENVVMSGLPGNPTTNASGVYSVTVTHGFSGTTTPTLAGNSFTPPTRTYTNVTAHQTDQDYTAALLTYTITGTVTRGGLGLENVVMSGLPGNPATNASGFYTATVNYGFSGTATPTLAGNAFTPPTRTYTNVTSNQSGQDYTATLLTNFISGTVMAGGAGLQNVVMSGLPGSPATNASGFYQAAVDYGWSGTVTPTLAGYAFTPPTRTYSNVTSAQTGQDYTAVLFTYTISGTVTAGGAGLQGVVISGLPGSPTTNVSGVYTATVDYGFSGTATPTLAGYSFTPPSRTYSNVNSNQAGQDYTATLNTLTISGTVTAGGVGLQGVILSGLPGSPATNSSGVYTATVDYGFSGTATPTLAGYSFVPPSRTYSNVTSDQTAQDYAASTVSLTISGTVTEGGAGLQGVVMNGLPGNPATDASGVYTSTVGYGFSGTVTPTLTNYTFTPPSRTYSNVTSNQTGENYTASLVPAPVIVLSRSKLNFGATSALKTSDQKFIISNGGGSTLDWSIADDAAWLSSSSASGTGEAEITVSVDQTGLATGTYNAVITVSSTTATNTPQTVNVTLVVIPASQVGNPAGSFDTPADGTSGITGAIAVTGWALDDIEVTRVEIKRDPAASDPAGARGADGLVFIGDAVFVDEARPDVEQAFPGSPLNYRAGWGYMLLTYGLPDQGNGSYRLHAFMYDKDGHRISLGTKTIQVDNAHAVNPFGTIDTPNQGGTASGTYTNFGWALTPMPSEIPKDGSTISVYVDGVYLGHPLYNQYRADIANSFPGYANSDGAVGVYDIDTTQYTNRVHTIGWLVTDNNGHADGIGSRFFTVFNAGSPNSAAQAAGIQGLRTALSPEEILRLPARTSGVQFRQGASSAERWQLGRMNREGANSVQMREVERLEVQLGQRGRMLGFLVVGKDLRPLPAGSTLDRRSGTFYWQPGPGFKGDYDFIFIGEDADGEPVKTALTVTIGPKIQK